MKFNLKDMLNIKNENFTFWSGLIAAMISPHAQHELSISLIIYALTMLIIWLTLVISRNIIQ